MSDDLSRDDGGLRLLPASHLSQSRKHKEVECDNGGDRVAWREREREPGVCHGCVMSSFGDQS